MNNEQNYSIKKYLPYIIGTITGAALITTSAIIGYKIYKKGLEDSLDLYYQNLEKGRA